MHPVHDYIRSETRRQFLSRGSNAVSWAALAALLGRDGLAPPAAAAGGSRTFAHTRPAAARCLARFISPPRPSR